LKRNHIGNFCADAAINGLKELSDAVDVLTFKMRNQSARIFKDWFCGNHFATEPSVMQLATVSVQLKVYASAPDTVEVSLNLGCLSADTDSPLRIGEGHNEQVLL
jgi:hypothetical protein